MGGSSVSPKTCVSAGRSRAQTHDPVIMGFMLITKFCCCRTVAFNLTPQERRERSHDLFAGFFCLYTLLFLLNNGFLFGSWPLDVLIALKLFISVNIDRRRSIGKIIVPGRRLVVAKW